MERKNALYSSIPGPIHVFNLEESYTSFLKSGNVESYVLKTRYCLLVATMAMILLCVALIGSNGAFAQNSNSVVQIIIPHSASTPQCNPACFIPDDVSVANNTSVYWINKDSVAHSITSGQPADDATGMMFDSGLIPPGGHFVHKFGKTGVYQYFDQVHPWDTGVVRVSDNVISVPSMITVTTNRESYYGGDTVIITGATNRYVSNSVLITIKDPHKNTILTSNVPLQQNSNSYKIAVLSDKKFSESGTYEVDATYGTAQHSTNFDFNLIAPTEDTLQVVGMDRLGSSLLQGQSANLDLVLKPATGYHIESLDLSLESLPDGVLSWIKPNKLYSTANSTHAQIPLYVNSNAMPGNYSISIIGDGTVMNTTSGKDVTYAHQRIMAIPLAILPSGSTLSVDVGPLDYTGTQFCTGPQGTARACTGFVSYEELPITVYSEEPQQVKISTSQVPDGGYVKFIPDHFGVQGNGSISRMVVAGIMEPFMINPVDTKTLEIQITSADGSTGIAYVPIIHRSNITVLTNPAPIKPDGNLISSGSQMAIIPFGVVYEPSGGEPSTLPVKLEALGLVNGSKIVPFTPSFNVTIPRNSFVLNSSEPYYFMVESTANSLPSGKITFAIGQDMGGQHFVQNVTLEISDVMHGGIQTFATSQSSQPSNSWMPTVGIGGLVGGGAGAISFFALRRKPSSSI